MVFIGAVVQRRQLHKGVGVPHRQRVGGRSHIAFQAAVISQNNAAHQAAYPNAGGVTIAGVVGVQLPDGDRAAGIAFVQRGPAHTGDAAHTQVVPGGVVAGVQLNVRHGGAAGDIHVGRAHQAAHAAAAPAGFILPVVLNGVAGHGAVGKGGSAGVIRPSPGKAHQTAQAVPVLPVSGILDNAAPVGVHDDVPKLCAGGEAEQPHALGTAGDGNVADGVVLPVKTAREEGGAGL